LLPNIAGRPVVDKTGLTAHYDLALPASALSPQPSSGASPPEDAPLGSDESIFTALPELLGLRLEPAKGQVEMLVIDHVERPTEN
jgi:uncharacterized protein (TIGR03435 family)